MQHLIIIFLQKTRFVPSWSEEKAGSSVGILRVAQASATIYSLVESAKANKLEPYKYLRYLFEKLPTTETVEDYQKLLPSQLSQEQLGNVFKVSQI